jgi:isoleucyl-tRNA synthetase
MAEELYQKLTGGESVHLTNWPTVIAGSANTQNAATPIPKALYIFCDRHVNLFMVFIIQLK